MTLSREKALVHVVDKGRPARSRCRSDSMELAAHPGAVAPARLRSRLVLRDWHLDELIDDVGQVVGDRLQFRAGDV